jgi:hypothetical protein
MWGGADDDDQAPRETRSQRRARLRSEREEAKRQTDRAVLPGKDGQVFLQDDLFARDDRVEPMFKDGWPRSEP